MANYIWFVAFADDSFCLGKKKYYFLERTLLMRVRVSVIVFLTEEA